MSVVWASQTEPAQRRSPGRHPRSWSLRRLLLALLVLACVLTLASAGATAGRAWHAADLANTFNSPASQMVSGAPATAAPVPSSHRSSRQPAFASGMASQWTTMHTG